MGRPQVRPLNSASCGVAIGKWPRLVPKLLPSSTPLGRVYRAQELHKLFALYRDRAVPALAGELTLLESALTITMPLRSYGQE